jgi:WD40 repeat protein
MAQSLLSGRLLTEGADESARAACAVTEADSREQIDPSALTEAAVWKTGEQFGGPRSAPSVASSAVLPGGTAVSMVESSGRRQPFFRSAAQIGRQAAQGLAYAHSRGVVHRDIKPSNLLLDTAGVVWITDFGLAKAEEDGLTATGDILGTLRYMAPERFRGEGDASADVYGLGLTLYELVTLKPAYDTPDRLKLIERIKNEEPQRPRSVDARIPRDLETIILKAIDKDPARRYVSADALAEDLRRFMADEPIQARRSSAAERYARWARRNPVIAMLGAVLTAVLVVATAGSLIIAGRMAVLAEKHRNAATAERLVRQAAVRTANAEAAARADADQAHEAAKLARDAAARQAAALLLDRGIEDARGGEPARALHLFVRALRTFPAGDLLSAPLERVIRANLSAWAETVPALEHIWTSEAHSTDVAFSPDGERLAMAIQQDQIQCFRSDTGLPVGPPIKIPVWDNAAMEFAADGKSLWVATSGDADFVNQWALHRLDPNSGRSIQPPISSPGPVNRLAVGPDGRYLVGAVWGLHREDRGPDNTAQRVRTWRTASIVVWEAASGRVVRRVDVNAECEYGTANVSPDTYLDLSRDGKSVTAWVQRATNRFEWLSFSIEGSEPPVRVGLPAVKTGAARVLHFENNLRTALAIKDGQLHRWSATTPGMLGPGIPTPFRAMLYGPSADGRSVLCPTDGRVYDTGTWPPRPSGVRFSHPGWERSTDSWMEQSADGRFNATWFVGRGDRRLWRLPRPHSRPSLPPANVARQPEVADTSLIAQFEPGGTSAILWSDRRMYAQRPDDTHIVRIVDVTTGAIRTTRLRHGALIRQVAISPDGRHFATGSFDTTARVWETATGRPAGPILPHNNYVATVAFSPDGNVLAAGDFGPAGLIKLWDWRTGKEVRPALRHDDIVLSVSFSPDGRYLAAVKASDWSKISELLVWEVTSGSVVFKVPYAPQGSLLPEPARFRPDNRAVLARDGTGVLRLWEVPSGKLLESRPLDKGLARFSPDGRVIAAAVYLGVRLLDGNTLAPLAGGFLPHADPTQDLAFSPDGAFLLTAHENGSAQLWDVATRKPVGPPAVLIGPIHAVAFTPDSKTCLCVAGDGTVRRWPVPTPLAEPDLARLADRIALMTGQRMDDSQGLDSISPHEWLSLRANLVGDGSTALVPPRADADWHDTVAADAEQDGDADGAEWHLDRLAALRPDDWTIPARRGRVLAAAGRRGEAKTAYAAARRLAPSAQVLSDWHRAAAANDESFRRNEPAVWNLDRAIALTPGDWTLYAQRATLAEHDQAVADEDEAIRLGAEKNVIERAADRAAAAGDWKRAAMLLTSLARNPDMPIATRYLQAVACLKDGDIAGYRAACAGMAERLPRGEPKVSHHESNSAASATTLGPTGTDDWPRTLAWTDHALSRLDEIEKTRPALKDLIRVERHRFLVTRGAVLYRAGRLEEAQNVLRGALSMRPDTQFHDWLFLALAEYRLGHADPAMEAAAKARAAAKPGTAWEQAEVELLKAELDAALPPPRQ